VGGARVFVNGYLAATTDEEGSYTLSNITSGSYHLLVEAEGLEFQEVVTTITPSEPYLPDLTPFRLGNHSMPLSTLSWLGPTFQAPGCNCSLSHMQFFHRKYHIKVVPVKSFFEKVSIAIPFQDTL
jgi:hypothetical protein